MHYKILLNLSLVFLGISFCFKSDVSGSIILHIGKVTITEYELEKNLELFRSDLTREKKRTPSDSDVINWINTFIDRTYFLADACDKGYDTAAEVTKWVESMAHYVVSKPDGLLQKIQPDFRENITVVKTQAQINTSTAAFRVVENYLKQNTIRQFDKNKFDTIGRQMLFTYKRADTLQYVETSRFMDYYNTLPLRQEIGNTATLQYYLESFVYDQYAWRQAVAYGITSDLKFLLDKNNYRNNVMWAAYELKELKAGVAVTDEEVRTRYAAIKESFTAATNVVISAFMFDDKRSAIMAMMLMEPAKPVLNNNTQQPLFLHKSFDYSDDLFTDSIRSVVFATKANGLLMPFPFNGKFIVVKKESASGSRTMSLQEVYQVLKKKMTAEKLAEKERDCLLRLKKIYTAINTIDYQKYLTTPTDKKG
jgi:hypothetical protein